MSAVSARPFLKWAGGKRGLLPELLKRIPAKYGTYYEPFLGGGALFFALNPKRAVLSDANLRLIRTYRAVRDHVENVIGLLHEHENMHKKHGAEYYYAVRNHAPDHFGDVGVAAWMICTNKLGFNGLYRVNKAGGFNVPYGKYANPTICDAENLRACARALQDIALYHEDFRVCKPLVSQGALLYADPPYAPLSKTANFTGYTKDGFGPQDQIDLRDMSLRLKERGVHIILSNSSAEVVKKLYGGFTVEEVAARRAINSKASARGPVKEYIIT